MEEITVIGSEIVSQQKVTVCDSPNMAAIPVQVDLHRANETRSSIVSEVGACSSPRQSVRKRRAGEMNSDRGDGDLEEGSKKLKQSSETCAPGAVAGYSVLVSMIQELSESVKDIAGGLERRIGEIEGNVEKCLNVKFNTNYG